MSQSQENTFLLFGNLFQLSQRLQYVTDYELKKNQLTTKQFLLLGAIEKAFDHPPSIMEVAYVLSTSHQNIKQIARQLMKKGFIRMDRDEKDRRRQLLYVTEKNTEYWESHAEESNEFVLSLFSCLTPEEINQLHFLTNKLYHGFDDIYREIRDS